MRYFGRKNNNSRLPDNEYCIRPYCADARILTPELIRFKSIPACDRQTDRQTDRQSSVVVAESRCATKGGQTNCSLAINVMVNSGRSDSVDHT